VINFSELTCGRELDAQIERESFKEAKNVYSGKGKASKAEIVTMAPDETMQKKHIRIEGAEYVSAFEVLDGIPIWEVTDAKLRNKLVSDVMDSEMAAIFEHGKFDRDSMIGNWIYSPKQKRLYRLDYPQIFTIKPEEIDVLKALLAELTTENSKKINTTNLSKSLQQALQFSNDVNTKTLSTFLNEIINDPHFPKEIDPHSRLLFIRDQLQLKLGLVNSGRNEHELIFRGNIGNAMAALIRLNGFKEHFTHEEDFYHKFFDYFPLTNKIKTGISAFIDRCLKRIKDN
jgi:hypothetical protein